MKEIPATEAKNSFGELLEMAMTEPIAIEKQERPVAVLMSFAEYQRLTKLEDRYWGERAKSALGSGFVAEEETEKWLKGKL